MCVYISTTTTTKREGIVCARARACRDRRALAVYPGSEGLKQRQRRWPARSLSLASRHSTPSTTRSLAVFCDYICREKKKVPSTPPPFSFLFDLRFFFFFFFFKFPPHSFVVVFFLASLSHSSCPALLLILHAFVFSKTLVMELYIKVLCADVKTLRSAHQSSDWSSSQWNSTKKQPPQRSNWGEKKRRKEEKRCSSAQPQTVLTHMDTHTHTQSQFFGLWNAEVSYCFFVPFISEFHPPSTSREIDLSSRHTTTTRKGNFKVFFSSLFLKGRLSLRLCAHLHLILMW